jgi:hypothetical protein
MNIVWLTTVTNLYENKDYDDSYDDDDDDE